MTESNEPVVQLHLDGHRATITINRPRKLNALNSEVLGALEKTVAEIGDRDDIWVVVLRGAGEKSFVAGADIAEMAQMTPLELRDHARRGQRVGNSLSQLAMPVIAAVDGYALGGGLELALACDFILASDRAVLGLPEVGLGLIPGFGGTQRLARRIGPGQAKELVFTARKVSAVRALAIGLVNSVSDAGEFETDLDAVCNEILAAGPVAVRLAKTALAAGLDGPLATGLAAEADAIGLSASTEDAKRGLAAFLEKRTPEYFGK